MDPIRDIVKVIMKVGYEDLPVDVIEAVKKGIVDTTGCAIAGSSSPAGKVLYHTVKDWGGKEESTIIVYGDKVPALGAALANSMMARCLELDDIIEQSKRGMAGHVSVTFVPACLALAESAKRPVSGKEFILAVAVGIDLAARILQASVQRIGWTQGTVSPFGVVASGAKLLDLSEEEILNAMGAAYAQCCGNVQSIRDGTWDVWLMPSNAARAGIMAIDLARNGYIGTKSPLLGTYGLYPLYFRGTYNEELLMGELGKEFESGLLSIKPYASCKFTHHPIYTTMELIRKHNIKPDEIEQIKMRTFSYAMKIVVYDEDGEIKYEPKNLNEAMFSIPFTVATAIVKGDVFPDVLNEGMLSDPAVLALSKKVTVELDPEKDKLLAEIGLPPTDVEIHTKDGQIYSGCEPFVKGHPENKMSFDECAGKFWKCARLSEKPLSNDKLTKFVDLVKTLEQVDDVRNIAEYLV